MRKEIEKQDATGYAMVNVFVVDTNPHRQMPDNEENFMFDIYANRVEMVKLVAAQRKLCDYVSSIYPDISKNQRYSRMVSWSLIKTTKISSGSGS